MSDVMPNVSLARAELELQMAEMDLSMRRMAVRKLQLGDEMDRINENETATLANVADLKLKLSALGKSGGGVTNG